MAPIGDSDDDEVSVIAEVSSPDQSPLASRVRKRPPIGDVGSSAQSTARRNLAKKKEAQEAEEYRINQILLEAGMNPDEYNKESRQQIAEALVQGRQEEGEREKMERQRRDFARDAGLTDEDIGDAVGSDASQSPKKVNEIALEDEDSIKPTPRKRIRRIQSTDDDDDDDDGKENNKIRPKQVGIETSTSAPPSSSTNVFDDVVAQYQSGYVHSAAEDGKFKFFRSKNARRVDGDDNNNENDAGESKSSKNQVSAAKSSARRTDADAAAKVRSPSFLERAAEKAVRAEASSRSIPPLISMSATKSFDGSFVKSTFSGFPSANDSALSAAAASPSGKLGPRLLDINEMSAASRESASPASTSGKGGITLRDIKQRLSNEESMKKFAEFRAECEAAKRSAVRDTKEGGIFTITCLDNVAFIPNTLIVDSEASQQLLPRRLQGGVQPFRSCRVAKVNASAAVARVTEDPDNDEDDFQQPKKRISRPSSQDTGESSKSGSQPVITLDDDGAPEEKDTQPCPICNKSVSTKGIEKHVDKCLESASHSGDARDEGERNPRARRRLADIQEDFLTI